MLHTFFKKWTQKMDFTWEGSLLYTHIYMHVFFTVSPSLIVLRPLSLSLSKWKITPKSELMIKYNTCAQHVVIQCEFPFQLVASLPYLAEGIATPALWMENRKAVLSGDNHIQLQCNTKEDALGMLGVFSPAPQPLYRNRNRTRAASFLAKLS